MELLELAKRVKRGVRLLDKKIPNWRTVLRRHEDQFDFADSEHCVLGTLEHYSGLLRVRKMRGAQPSNPNPDAFNRASVRLGIYARRGAGMATADLPVYQQGFEAVDANDEDRAVLDALWRAEFSK